MPLTIGAKPESSFADPLGLLQDCHRRIERFLGVIVTVISETNGSHLSDEQRTALDTALRYFREAAPKHTEDEEFSLFPRLREQGGKVTREALSTLDRLEADHVAAKDWHKELDTLGQRWLSGEPLREQDSSRFRELAGQLSTLYERHINVEDRELFPRAHSILTREHLTAIGHEMAKRRGLAMSPSSLPLKHGLQPSGVVTPPRPTSTMDKE